MNIQRLELLNFRSAAETAFDFDQKLNLFVGINGSGKSTVLDALSICLSWLVKRIERDNGRGTYIQDASLRNGEMSASLRIHAVEGRQEYNWLLTKTTKGRDGSGLLGELTGVSELASVIRKRYDQRTTWPVIAYYPIQRVVGSTSPDISDRDSAYDLDVYDNALGGKANYQSFFEWFRLQDDILNERAQSRSKWMKQNRDWIKRRVARLIDLLQKSAIHEDGDFDGKELQYFVKHLEKDEMLYEEPRFLFLELSHLTEMVSMRLRDNDRYVKMIHDLDHMLHKMASLSKDSRDDLIDEGGFHQELLERVFFKFARFLREDALHPISLEFLWQSFTLATLLSLWWLSEKSKRNLERQLRSLWEASNSAISREPLMEDLVSGLQKTIRYEIQRNRDNDYRQESRELHAVTAAIEKFLPEYTDLRVKRVPRPHMLIDKNGQPFNLDQLSDGEKSMIALVGDIARRLAIGNPSKSNPLEGEGVILIDEIDLHLHPRWQRFVIPKLLEVFKNCQFFISTHSPQVVSHVKPEHVFLLTQADGRMTFSKADETYGMSVDRVLDLVMEDESRPVIVRQALDKLFVMIERRKFPEAKDILASLKTDMPTDPELLRAEMLLRREEARG